MGGRRLWTASSCRFCLLLCDFVSSHH